MYSTGLAGEYRRSTVQDIKLPKCGMKKFGFRTAIPQLLTTPAICRPQGKTNAKCNIIIVGTTASCFFAICSKILKTLAVLVKGIFCIKNDLSAPTVAFVGSVKSLAFCSCVKQMHCTSKFALYFANGLH